MEKGFYWMDEFLEFVESYEMGVIFSTNLKNSSEEIRNMTYQSLLFGELIPMFLKSFHYRTVDAFLHLDIHLERRRIPNHSHSESRIFPIENEDVDQRIKLDSIGFPLFLLIRNPRSQFLCDQWSFSLFLKGVQCDQRQRNHVWRLFFFFRWGRRSRMSYK